MNQDIEQKLISFVREHQSKNDISHDFEHVLRVRNLAQKIAESVNADLEVVIPAALFHDIVVYKKNSEESKSESDESAEIASKVLKEIKEYPSDKIERVVTCIKECSFSKQAKPESIESQVLQDADRLEATGAIAIMRTFASCEGMKRPFYPEEDPLCKNSVVAFRSGIDLFYRRLLVVESVLHTEYAKRLAHHRTEFLESFLEQLERELREDDIL